MKDYFSIQSKAYARYRPTYPDELFDFILSHIEKKNIAWDCGTGNGQVAVKLSQRFETVYATDLSENQISQAPKMDNIIYRVMTAENAGFKEERFDLITIAQAIHWFDFDLFYQNVKRFLKPEGVIAAIGYGVIKIDAACDKIITRLYADILGNYWDPERKHIDEHYRTIPFPFVEISTPEYGQKAHWSFEQLIGYLNTWSSVQHYIRKHRQNPVDLVLSKLKNAWGTAEKKEVRFPVFLRVGTVDR